MSQPNGFSVALSGAITRRKSLTLTQRLTSVNGMDDQALGTIMALTAEIAKRLPPGVASKAEAVAAVTEYLSLLAIQQSGSRGR